MQRSVVAISLCPANAISTRTSTPHSVRCKSRASGVDSPHLKAVCHSCSRMLCILNDHTFRWQLCLCCKMDGMTVALSQYNQARKALAAAPKVVQVKEVRNKATALLSDRLDAFSGKRNRCPFTVKSAQ